MKSHSFSILFTISVKAGLVIKTPIVIPIIVVTANPFNKPKIQNYVYGGKCVGSGGDGTAQFICKSKAAREEAKKILAFERYNCLDLDLKITE